MNSLWWATTLVLRPHNSTTAAKSCREPFLLPPTTTVSHQKFLSNPCRSRPNKWQRNRSSATAVFKTCKLFSTVLPPKFSPFLNDIKDGFLLSSDTLFMIEQLHRLFIDTKLRKSFLHEFQETWLRFTFDCLDEWSCVASCAGTLRYRNADALKYVTVEESLGRVHGVGGGKIKLRSAANDETLLSSSIWLLLGKLENCCV